MAMLNSLSIKDQPVLSAFTDFIQKLKDTEWLFQSSRDEIKNCLQSARAIEKILDSLETNGALNSFMSLVPDLYGLELEQLRKACDIVLCMVLTAPGVSVPCVRTCIDQYFQHCGLDRFVNVVSYVIICSEIYRVLLDYVASFDGHLKQTGIELQSYIFICMWKNESDFGKLEQTYYNWLKRDTSGQSMAVSMQVIIHDDSGVASSSLVLILNKILRERKNEAMMFWKTFNELPEIAEKVLQKSEDLLNGVLDFLKVCGQWLEATPSFSWVSREKGACKAFGYEELACSVKFLIEASEPISERTKQFLCTQRNSAGCTLWDDVDMKL